MSVRCKVRCTNVGQVTGWGGGDVQWNYKFYPVTDGSEENKTLWKYTPSGTFEFQCVNNVGFEIGKEYYLDFTLAEPDQKPVSRSLCAACWLQIYRSVFPKGESGCTNTRPSSSG